MQKIIKDRLYNTIQIDNPIIWEFIQTSPFQRLKKINQYGGVNLVYPEYQVTRFEHSLGVWHILKTLGADLETQVAGLLHDIGHTAFSHMVDHALQNPGENFHEKHLDLIDNWQEISSLLTKYSISLKNVEDYPQIKKQMPYIGADRLDYAIRDYVGATNKSLGFGVKILKSTRFIHKSIVFTNSLIAKEYALKGLKAMWLVVYDPKVAVVYQALTEILRQGLAEGWITYKDLFTDDKSVLQLFLKYKHKLDEKYIIIFTKKFKVIQGNKDDYHFKHTKTKVRYFDPHILHNGSITKLSKVDASFSSKLQKAVALFEQAKYGNYLKLVVK